MANVLHAILTVDDKRAFFRDGATQSCVQDRAILGGVDVHAFKHGMHTILQLKLTRKVEQELMRGIINQIFGEVKVNVFEFKAIFFDAIGVVFEPRAHVDARFFELIDVCCKLFPGLSLGRIERCRN